MLLTEYDEVEQMELFKEDGRREGIESGRKEGITQGAEKTMEMLGVPKEEWGKYLSMLKEDSEVYGE